MNRLLFKFALAAAVAAGMGTAAFALEFKEGAKDASVASAGNAQATEAKGKATAETFVEKPNGAMAQDQKHKEEPNSAVNDASKSALTRITEIFNAECKPIDNDKKAAYDEKTGRIAVVVSVHFDVQDPDVDTDFLKTRASKMTELLIRAKAEIATAIFSKMSAERILEIPGNPIEKQLNEEKEKVEKAVAKLKKALDAAGLKVDEARLDKDRMSLPELVASASTLIKENDNYAANLDKDKKSKYDAAKNTYEQVKAEYEALLEKAKTIKDDLKDKMEKKVESAISISSEMQLHGCSILEQADYCDLVDGKYQYEIAVIFTWSMEAQLASEYILSGRKLVLEEGGHSINEWVEHYAKNGALGDWMGPRTYIDDERQLWFIGIAATPVKSRANDQDKEVQIAALRARAEVGYALYSDVQTASELKTLSVDLDINGKTLTKVLEDYSEKTSEKFAKLSLFGLTRIGQYKLKHSTGQQINVLVYGINAANAEAMKKNHQAAHEAGIRINLAQQFEAGRLARMHQQQEASKDSQVMRDAGSQAADAALKGPQRTEVPPADSVKAPQTPNNANPDNKGRLGVGGRMYRGKW